MSPVVAHSLAPGLLMGDGANGSDGARTHGQNDPGGDGEALRIPGNGFFLMLRSLEFFRLMTLFSLLSLTFLLSHNLFPGSFLQRLPRACFLSLKTVLLSLKSTVALRA